MSTLGPFLIGTMMVALSTGELPHQAEALASMPLPEVCVAAPSLPSEPLGVDPVSAPDEPSPIGARVAGLAEPVRMLTSAGMFYLPRGFHATDGEFDVVLHFHGAPQAVEPALERARINAALLTVNLGVGSGVYESAYQDAGALGRAVAAVQSFVDKRGNAPGARVRRVALSAWSAGYGAVSQILRFASTPVDAVLLADGLHAGYVDARKHTLDDRKMEPFARFAASAAGGDRLMALTHSSIGTSGYASTTETAAYLLEKAGVEAQRERSVEQRGMVRRLVADRGNLHVRGFEGETKEAHCDHLHAMGETLLPLLASRWNES